MKIARIYDEHEAKKLGFNDEEDECEEQDFISSDLCFECGGEGKLWNKNGCRWEQCEECEELHHAEIRADRMMDEAKEGA